MHVSSPIMAILILSAAVVQGQDVPTPKLKPQPSIHTPAKAPTRPSPISDSGPTHRDTMEFIARRLSNHHMTATETIGNAGHQSIDVLYTQVSGSGAKSGPSSKGVAAHPTVVLKREATRGVMPSV